MTPIEAAIAIPPAITLCYGLVCAGSPLGDCRKCRGFGFAMKTDRKGRPKRGKHCRRCDGHGKRIRIGRRLFNAARRTWHDATAEPAARAARKDTPPWR
ncbi:hypothetical protein K7472_24845 [Streptomyces sp. PTM05]|uniref:Uncharacterized protein n=2 Tax=Streptantibioticus parmotrematis TaxID=2873249 RepID=A0ABS7QXW0_9ACTN|nr:hypothetical protein [Streptantibioticus parmotrematis]MBY8888043.1 hypothetical protein [Streptantibioticus parmotrematis]